MGSAGWFCWFGWGLTDPGGAHFYISCLGDRCWLGCLHFSSMWPLLLQWASQALSPWWQDSQDNLESNLQCLCALQAPACIMLAPASRSKKVARPAWFWGWGKASTLCRSCKVILQKTWTQSREEFVAFFFFQSTTEWKKIFAIYHRCDTHSPSCRTKHHIKKM